MTIEKVTSYLYTADEAAGMLGISAALVRRYCRQGRLGKRVGNQWQILPRDLEKFQAKPRKSGNPNFGRKVTK
jgi:predicted site-specific integrase-resolvase